MELPSGFIFTLKVKGFTKIEVCERELITCKHCIHCADDWNGDQPMFTCELGRCGESVQPNDFCSYAEKS